MNLQSSYLRSILWSALFCTIATTIVISFGGFHEESLRILIRWSSKFSTLFFSFAICASGLHQLFQWKFTKAILRYRAHLGLSFGVFHTFHLLFLLILQFEFHPVFSLAKSTSLIGGGLAYLFMYLMMLTTFPKIKNFLNSLQWKYLHLIGAYWIWGIFTRTYSKKVFFWDEGYLLFGLLIFVLIIRVFDYFSKQYNRKKIVT